MALITSFIKFILPDFMKEIANFFMAGREMDPALSCRVESA